MFAPLLPQPADNTYRGHKLAIVLFALLLLMKSAISLGSLMPIARTGGSSASTIGLVILALITVGVVLSLWSRQSPEPVPPVSA